jgi:hypothetical protein
MATMIVSEVSYRRATEMMNRILHRAPCDALKERTFADFVEGFGETIGLHIKSIADSILEKNRFDAGTLAMRESARLPESVPKPGALLCRRGGAAQEQDITEKVEGINSVREASEQVKRLELVSAVERSELNCCYISIDDVGVKRQKETRKEGGSKSSRFVENTVIHVQADGQAYHLTAVGMQSAFAVLMAFLLENHLMEGRRLVFLADGARDILNHIETHFSFCDHAVILDWYHLKKKCKELISSSVKGKKDEKQGIQKRLLRILWAGNVDEAVEYLNGLDRRFIKSDYWLGELTGYFQRKKPQIACYALRYELGLRNSSNRVEKDNDLLVAKRQKNNGMSWSSRGSGALAAIKMLILNNDMEQWLYTRSLSFSMPLSVAA